MLNISEIIAKAETMFDLFNDHFYGGEMIRPAITVSPDGGRGAYGWCTVYEIWQANGEAYREINICAEYINRPISDVAATMLHEMAHLYNLTHGILPQQEIQGDRRGPWPGHQPPPHLRMDGDGFDAGNRRLDRPAAGIERYYRKPAGHHPDQEQWRRG